MYSCLVAQPHSGFMHAIMPTVLKLFSFFIVCPNIFAAANVTTNCSYLCPFYFPWWASVLILMKYLCCTYWRSLNVIIINSCCRNVSVQGRRSGMQGVCRRPSTQCHRKGSGESLQLLWTLEECVGRSQPSWLCLRRV